MAEETQVEGMRDQASAIFRAGIEAADPRKAVERVLRVHAQHLELVLEPGSDSSPVRSEPWRRVHLVAFGKAACAMAAAARELLPPSLLSGQGIVVTNYENVTEVPGLTVIGASHPLPDDSGLRGAQAIAERVQQAQAEDLLQTGATGTNVADLQVLLVNFDA